MSRFTLAMKSPLSIWAAWMMLSTVTQSIPVSTFLYHGIRLNDTYLTPCPFRPPIAKKYERADLGEFCYTTDRGIF